MKRIFRLSLIPILLVFASVGLRVVDPPFLETFRLRVFDLYQQIEPRPYTPVPVKVIDLDEESLNRVGQWPWPRTIVADMVRKIQDAGAAAVAFDIVFAEPDRTSPENVVEYWSNEQISEEMARQIASLPDHDDTFARALGDSRSVVGFVLIGEENDTVPLRKAGFAWAGGSAKNFVPGFPGAVTSLLRLQQAAMGNGSLNFLPDSDGIVRRVPLFVRKGDTVFPTLAAEALRVAQGASGYVVKSAGASGVQSFGEKSGLTHVKIGNFVAPVDQNGQMWVYHTGARQERRIPAWEVLEGLFNPQSLNGAIVFIGTSAAGLKDLRATPLAPAEPGVEIQAQVVEQILLQQFLQRPDWVYGAEVVGLLFIGVMLVYLVVRIGTIWGGVLAAAAILGGTAVSWFMFAKAGMLFGPIYPSIVIVTVFLSASISNHLSSEAQRRQVRAAFSRYMSPVLVERLAEDPSRLKLGGEIRDMTLMFCDVRNFTTISENLEPEELTTLLNRLLTPLTDTIQSHNGIIDKYMGDAVMAFWNAPLDDSDHAGNAVRASLEMLRRVDELNAELEAEGMMERTGGRRLKIGIGIASGPACVGNMGSEQRFDYSVLGDVVNVASRLEGQSKVYGVPVVISAQTKERLDGFALIELDWVQVKGRAEPIQLYTVLGSSDLAKDEEFRELQTALHEFLDAYRRQAWNDAGIALRRGEVYGHRFGLDALFDLYRRRIEEYRARPPEAEWTPTIRAVNK